ncbi:MAG: type II toxin-antitoxin system PemK/MazF family toxin [Candidatus Paceibacterota bacterium]
MLEKEKHNIIKKFLEWIGLKEKLHNKESRPPFVSEGDIWWISLGENVGSEINGKSEIFTRPGIIYKKLSHSFYLIIPTTTKDKRGSWYVGFIHKNIEMFACLHQVRVVDYRRLFSKLGTLDGEDFKKVRIGFNSLYK